MNSKGIIAVTDHTLCMKCLEKKATVVHKMTNRGYGSCFDSLESKLQLCDDCDDRNLHTWFSEEGTYEDYCEDYKYEDNIFGFVKQLPLQGQELFFNTFEGGWNTHRMDAQDWIDYELKELPHDKCKEYCMYSPQEITAYETNFPTCSQVYLQVYSDGSSHCKCPFGAYGEKDGSCGANRSTECYMCTSYSPRIDKMKTVNVAEDYLKNETKRLQDMLRYARERLDVIPNGYDAYLEKFGE